MKWVVHVYLANFYTVVQKRLKPELAAEPLIILKHNRVLDADPRAEKLGVKLRSSRRHAYQLCSEGLYLGYAEEDYRHAVHEVLNRCCDYTPVIEPVAENEFYLELAGPHTPEQVIEELTQGFVPTYCTFLSAGIGVNKLLAKISNMALNAGRLSPQKIFSSDLPVGNYNWLNCQGQEEISAFLRDLPVSYLWPVEKKTREHLSRLGFATLGEVAEVEQEILRREFGVQGRLIHDWARGRDLSQVLTLYPPRNMIREVSFPGGLSELKSIESALKNIGEQLAQAFENQGCRKLALELQLEEGTLSSSRSFSSPQNRAVALQEVLGGMVKRMEINQPVIGLKVCAQDLRPVKGVQLSMFEDPKALAGEDKQQRSKLNTLLEGLGKRFAPQNFSLGKQETLSRREQMLKYWDPLRFKER